MELILPLKSDGTPYDEFKSAPIVCKVVTAPRKLIFGVRTVVNESVFTMDATPAQRIALYNQRREAKYTENTTIEAAIPGSMMWKTTMDVKEGDIVWVNSNFFLNAAQRGNVIICDNQVYYIMHYGDLYLKKDTEGVTMLNGWVLAELVEDSPDWTKRAEKAGIIVPDHLKKQEFKDRVAIIRYIGNPVEYIHNERYDHPEIKDGDTVLLSMKVNRRLEPGQKFFAKDGCDLIVTRRCNIIGIF
jgi:co-chaperonin GroES (HSP10)